MNLRLTALFALLLALPAAAQPKQDRPGFMSEDFAVEIEADSAELSERRDTSIYRGHVRLTRGPLTMLGNELQIHRDADNGRITATLSGSPAKAIHTTPGDTVPVTASAGHIIYTTQVEILELQGQAEISRGADRLTGEQVRYDVANARIEADGGKDRVRIVITPPEQDDATKP